MWLPVTLCVCLRMYVSVRYIVKRMLAANVVGEVTKMSRIILSSGLPFPFSAFPCGVSDFLLDEIRSKEISEDFGHVNKT